MGMNQYALFICHKGAFSILRKDIKLAWTPEQAIEESSLASNEEAWVYIIPDKPIHIPEWAGGIRRPVDR